MQTAAFLSLLMITFANGVVPGPAMIFIASSAVGKSSAKVAAALAGLVLGTAVLLCVTLMISYGLLTIEKELFEAMRWVGTVVLLYIAWSLWPSRASTLSSKEQDGLSDRPFFVGFALSVSQPLHLAFMIAIFPQFLSPLEVLGPTQALCIIAAVLIGDLLAMGSAALFAGRFRKSLAALEGSMLRVASALMAVFATFCLFADLTIVP